MSELNGHEGMMGAAWIFFIEKKNKSNKVLSSFLKI